MAEKGLWITNDNGGSYFNLASGGARAITFLQRIKADNSNTTMRYTISNKSSGTTLMVVPVHSFELFQPNNTLSVISVCTKSISVSGNVVIINFNNTNTGQPFISRDGYFYYDVYETTEPSAGSYGLFMRDSTDFSAITDATKSGLCVYRNTVTVNGTWTVPNSIPNRANCSVFANWNSASAVVEYNPSSFQITTKGSVTLNIAIFSNGFQLTMPSYGFYIFNSHGQCTYNSNYIPLFVKKTVAFSGASLNTGVTKPLIPLYVVGGEAQDLGGSTYDFYNKGIVMSGSTIRSGRGKLVLAAAYTDYDLPY
ncbi:MAG: DUF6453 family protein, partial [Pantoea sp.]|nr:DUF6453 family protein [Pantoea sp.]